MNFIFCAEMSLDHDATDKYVKLGVTHDKIAKRFNSGDFELYANHVGHDWVLNVDMGTIDDYLDLGAKPYIIDDRRPTHLYWNYAERVFVLTDEASFSYSCHPMFPDEFDIPYNNASRRTRVLNILFLSLLQSWFFPMSCDGKFSIEYAEFANHPYQHSVFGKMKKLWDEVKSSVNLPQPVWYPVTTVSDEDTKSTRYMRICRILFACNADLVEMGLLVFVERFIAAARRHRNTSYFITCPELLPVAKRARRTNAVSCDE